MGIGVRVRVKGRASPAGMFITVRGIDTLGPSFRLPTCERVFNIFHPFDPVAYRLETLIDTAFVELRPVLVPHHKGRKRMHLGQCPPPPPTPPSAAPEGPLLRRFSLFSVPELKDTIERVGADIKNKIVESLQSTWNKFYQMYAGSASEAVRAQMDQVGWSVARSLGRF